MKQSQEAIEQRRRRLLSLLQDGHNSKVLCLAEQLNVSELTIRRDLNALAEEHLIERYHGGAHIIDFSNELHVSDKNSRFLYEKDLIGEAAAELVPNNATIFLGSGSTTLNILKHLGNKRVTIVTNNALAPAYVDSERITLILCGGECRIKTKSLIGHYAEDVIRSIYFDIAFLGANGISLENGVTTEIYQEAKIYECIVNNCTGSIILMATSNKFGKTYSFKILDLNTLDILITDSSVDSRTLRELGTHNIRTLIADQNIKK